MNPDVENVLVNLVTEDRLLELIPALTPRILRELRYRRRIPFVKLSYRRRLYDPKKIVRALRKLEMQPK
jgi:hypothetical protein